MKLTLLTLTLRNFKGMNSFTFDTGGGDVDIYGDNSTGKTTLMDAFLWLLFDKDSANKKEFGIKTLDAAGQELHGLEHEVEGVLALDGQMVSLRKVLTEKWTKKRGGADRTFEGHTTNYWIDGVPAKLSEYKARVAEICDENVFRLLTDPSYFNQVMKWQDRRALLLEVCGDITDSDVIASDDSLAKLPEILGNRSLDDHRKVIAARRAEINKALQTLPVRIDEVTQGLPEVSGSTDSIESNLNKIRAAVQKKHQEKARLEAGGEVAEKRRKLSEARAELQTIENAARAAADEKTRAARQAAGDLTYRIDTITQGVQSRENGIAENQNSIRRLEADMDKLREKWQAVNAETFEKDMEEHDTVCYACGQNLPAERIQEAHDKALAAFNASRAERLERIDAEGKQAKDEAGSRSLSNERLRKEIQELEVERDKLADEKATMPELSDEDITWPDAHAETLDEIAILESEIARLGEGNTEALTAVTAEITDMQQQIREGENQLAAFAQVAQGKERIEELSAQEKQLGAEYEKLESELYLCETFVRSKVGLLEEKINSKFQLARFKLFNELINGGLEECCETTFEGVPYGSGLNNGARINVGLDIILALSEHYGFSAPIYIDNSESVTKLIDMDAQIIRLVVSAKDSKLRIETKTDLKEAVNG